jgi:hypothetical protein
MSDKTVVICDVGQHDRIGNEAGVFELLLLFDRIATLDQRAPERNPIEEVVVGLYFGGFGADDASDFGVGDVAQQKQRTFDPARLSEGAVEQASAVMCAKLS